MANLTKNNESIKEDTLIENKKEIIIKVETPITVRSFLYSQHFFKEYEIGSLERRFKFQTEIPSEWTKILKAKQLNF
jgi:hypothetical protein